MMTSLKLRNVLPQTNSCHHWRWHPVLWLTRLELTTLEIFSNLNSGLQDFLKCIPGRPTWETTALATMGPS